MIRSSYFYFPADSVKKKKSFFSRIFGGKTSKEKTEVSVKQDTVKAKPANPIFHADTAKTNAKRKDTATHHKKDLKLFPKAEDFNVKYPDSIKIEYVKPGFKIKRINPEANQI